MVIKGLKGQKEFVTISQRLFLIDEGLTSSWRDSRMVGSPLYAKTEAWVVTVWTGEKESSSILVLSGEVGGFRAAGVE